MQLPPPVKCTIIQEVNIVLVDSHYSWYKTQIDSHRSAIQRLMPVVDMVQISRNPTVLLRLESRHAICSIPHLIWPSTVFTGKYR